MPKENRSSNTETKIQHPEGRRERFLKWVLATKHPVLGYLDGTWLARGDDREGYADKYVQGLWVAFKEFAQPAPQPHPDPIAWMVGTAFWWTKEEAERDAAATGLPIVGLGPMAMAAHAEQHQGEPVAMPARKKDGQAWAGGWNACLDEIAKLGPLYSRPVQGKPLAWLDPNAGLSWLVDRMTVVPGAKLYAHADPAYVEQGYHPSVVQALQRTNDELREECGIMRAQLTEAQALLARTLPYLSNTPDLVQHGAEELAAEIRSASAGRPCYGPNEWGTECGQCSKCKSASAESSALAWACQLCQLEQPTDRPCDVCGGKTEPVATKP